MKFIRPTDRPAGGSSGVVGHSPYGKPQWLREWLENQGKFVRLKCGHKEDMNYKGLLVIFATFKKVDIFCDRCNAWTSLGEPISFREYMEIPPPESSQIPLF